MKEYIKKNYKVLITLLIIIVIGTIGLTLANEIISANIALGTGEYNVVYTGTATLPTTALEPIYDTELLNSSNASKIMKVEFTVKGASTNPTDIPIIYDVSLTNLKLPTELQSSLLKWKLFKNGTEISTGSFSKDFDAQGNNRMVLTEIQQDLPSYSSTADSYKFYVWISEECSGDISTCTPGMNTQPLMGKTFSGEIRIELSTKNKKQLVRFTGDAGATLVNLGLSNSYIDETPDFSKISPTVGTYKVSETAVKTYNLDTTRSQYYVTYSSTYDFDKTYGTYSLTNADVAQYSTIYQSLVDKYITNYTLSNSSTMETTTGRGKIYKITDATYDSSAKTGVIKYTELSKEISMYDTSDTGIFKSEDDLGTSYYFRGNVTNNYVKFAGLFWRIIRINGDGTVRMIYDGTYAHANGDASQDRIVGTSAFNSTYSSNGHVGYMYGSTLGSTYELEHANDVNSTIKTYLEGDLGLTNAGWYYENIIAKGYDDYVADAIYCNDRSLDTSSSSYTGIGTKKTYYAPRKRLTTNKTPSLFCSRVVDRFTKGPTIGNINGNSKLKYPVGLITADEVAMAGIINEPENKLNYLYKGNVYWTMSPSAFQSSYSYEYALYSGKIYDTDYYTYTNNGVAPVISLKADAINSGSGTRFDPFEVGTSPALTTLTNLGLTDSIKTDVPKFEKASYSTCDTSTDNTCETTVGIYAAEDDIGTSYYFRGDVDNNYVKFGKWSDDAEGVYYGYYSDSPTSEYREYKTLDACQEGDDMGWYNVNCTFIPRAGKDMYWRIIRINGDGTIRMIYDGTSLYNNGESSADRTITTDGFYSNSYYSESRSNAYVGYMYGSTLGVSYELEHSNDLNNEIKEKIDTWYVDNLKNTIYDEYVADAIYCNDRSLFSGTGIGKDETYYNTYQRVIYDKKPILICNQKNDRFTLNDSVIATLDGKGTNKKLEVPIGTITADEILMAGGGGYSNSNSNFYLYVGWTYYTFSPAYLDGSTSYIIGFNSCFCDRTSAYNTGILSGIRPVISLKADVLKYDAATSNGTKEYPFVLK